MSLRKQASSGVFWTFGQQFGNQIISFIVSVILARLLLPEEFGLVGMIAIFYSLGKGLMEAGLTQSLIRSNDLDEEDYSTVFFFNLGASLLIYTIIFFAAPLIAQFYDRPILIGLTRLLCVTFVIDAFTSVQRTRLTKKMNFRTQAIISIPSAVVGGSIGIIMAFLGYGVWSLVWSSIAVSLISSIQFWIYSKWVPLRVFRIKKFKYHFSFGYKLTIAKILSTIFNNIYIIVIGKFFSASQVGFYTRAESLNQLPVNNISSALEKVTYPLFAVIQEDNKRLKEVYRQIIQSVIFVTAPVLTFLAVLAEPCFVFLFGNNWLPAVPYFQILCFTGILYPINAYNLNVLKVKGRSDIFLKLEVIKRVIMVVIISITLFYGIYVLLLGQVLISIIEFFINARFTKKFIDYTVLEQIKDLLPALFISLISGIFVFGADHLLDSQINILRLMVGSAVGLLSYLLISILFKIEGYYHIKKIILKENPA